MSRPPQTSGEIVLLGLAEAHQAVGVRLRVEALADSEGGEGEGGCEAHGRGRARRDGKPMLSWSLPLFEIGDERRKHASAVNPQTARGRAIVAGLDELEGQE